MSNLTKIKDMSSKYGISARTLRYYEDMGLIVSTRTDDYAYRLYDETAVKKLEQILILRKLNISIKDIHQIFNSSGSGIVLDVLGKKVEDIDSEVSLLHELKQIILSFIRHIENADFNKESDVKLLYDKAKEIEQQIVNVSYEGNPSSFKNLLELSDQLNKRHLPVMIIKLPKCKVITTGWQWEDDIFHAKGGFNDWIWENQHLHKEVFFGTPTFWFNKKPDYHGEQTCYNITVHDTVTEADAAPYNLIEFEGGMYAALHGTGEAVNGFYPNILKWLEDTHFEPDYTRFCIAQDIYHAQNIFHTSEIREILGDHQMLLAVPIQPRAQNETPTANTLEDGRAEMVKKFFTAFHERFGAKLERRFTDFDFDVSGDAHISYMFQQNVTPGVSVVFEINADEHDPCVFAGLGMIKSDTQAYFGDKEMVNTLRAYYGVNEKKTSDWLICFDYLTFEGETINLMKPHWGNDNYAKLFDPEKFDKIVDSAVEQAQQLYAKLRQN